MDKNKQEELIISIMKSDEESGLYNDDMKIKVIDIVRDRSKMANFSYFCGGNLYYTVEYNGELYQFPISTDIKEVGTAPFDKEIKVITLMRYIRSSIKNGEFIKIK